MLLAGVSERFLDEPGNDGRRNGELGEGDEETLQSRRALMTMV